MPIAWDSLQKIIYIFGSCFKLVLRPLRFNFHLFQTQRGELIKRLQ